METGEILKHVDHTALKAFCTWADIQKLCGEAITYGMASVCVPPCYIRRIHDTYGEKLNICTVIGFPLGYSTTASKVQEARDAVADGASEIDMVINIADVKNGDYQKVEEEIRANSFKLMSPQARKAAQVSGRAVDITAADFDEG